MFLYISAWEKTDDTVVSHSTKCIQNLNCSTNVFLKITFYDLRVTTKSLNKSMQIFEREHKYAPKYVPKKAFWDNISIWIDKSMQLLKESTNIFLKKESKHANLISLQKYACSRNTVKVKISSEGLKIWKNHLLCFDIYSVT